VRGNIDLLVRNTVECVLWPVAVDDAVSSGFGKDEFESISLTQSMYIL
jgi:hypothetical protein